MTIYPGFPAHSEHLAFLIQFNVILRGMSSDFPHPEVSQTDDVWHEIDELVEEITQLAASELPAPRFYAALLDRIMAVLAATGGAIWVELPEKGLQLVHEINAPDRQLTGSTERRESHARLVDDVMQAGIAKAIPPRREQAGGEEANPTDSVLLLAPWRVDDELGGVVELFQRSDVSPASQRGYLRFLTIVAELVSDFHRNRLLRELRHRTARLGRFSQFVERIHASLDLKTTAYQIANEGRPVVGCDRLSMAVVRGSRCRLLSVSGVDTINRRANVVRHLERLCAAVVAVGEPFWHPRSSAEAPPEIENPMVDYLDAAHVKALAVIPLRRPQEARQGGSGEVLGVLIVEQFHGEFDDRLEQSVGSVLGHCGAALGNALELERVPLARFWRTVGKARWLVRARQLPKTLLALLALVGAAIALATVPADFEIEVPGELQPAVRREVFAPYDGIVSELAVDHGSPVKSGQTLVQIRRPELDFERQRVLGELQTARKKLAATEAERLQNLRQTEEQRRRYGQLTAEEEELREAIRGLEKQRGVLEAQQSELRVASPIDGEVITWDLRQLLNSRPVARGQALMTVADCQGPWVLELRIPDDRVAHVLKAERSMGPRLDMSFILATDPGNHRQAKLELMGLRAEAAEAGDPFVLATAAIEDDAIPDRVPGATVAAKIHCGRRPVGYVWFRDLIEAIQRWILF